MLFAGWFVGSHSHSFLIQHKVTSLGMVPPQWLGSPTSTNNHDSPSWTCPKPVSSFPGDYRLCPLDSQSQRTAIILTQQNTKEDVIFTLGFSAEAHDSERLQSVQESDDDGTGAWGGGSSYWCGNARMKCQVQTAAVPLVSDSFISQGCGASFLGVSGRLALQWGGVLPSSATQSELH